VLQKFIEMLPTASAYVAEMIVRTIALCAKNEKSQQIFCEAQAVPLLLSIGLKNLPSSKGQNPLSSARIKLYVTLLAFCCSCTHVASISAGAHSRLLMYALWALAVLSSNKQAAAQIASSKFEGTDGIG